MNNLRVNKINEYIWSFTDNLYATCYLILGKEKALLIDSGWGVINLEKTIRTITDLPLIAIATHGHPDHLYGMLNFSKIYIHKDDYELATKIFKKRKVYSFFICLLNKLGFKWFNDFKKKAVPEIIEIDEKFNNEISSFNLEIVHLPGHTPGSIVLLDKTNKILFSGDTIVKYPWLSLKESLPLDIYLNSLIKMNEIIPNECKIYSGHSEEPLNYTIIQELINCCNSIKRNELTNKFYFHPYTRGRLYKDKNVSILLKS